MLRIVIVGDDGQQHALDLKPGTVLEMEETAPAFDNEMQEGSFALPFELPWSEKNRRTLQAAEFLESAPGGLMSWVVDVYDDGVLELAGGLLTLLSHKGSLDYTSGATSATITGSASRFGRLAYKARLASIRMGDDITYWSPTGINSARGFAQLVTDTPGIAPGVAFAPVYAPNFIDTGHEDYDGEMLINNTVNNIIHSFMMGRWYFAVPGAAENTEDWCKYRTVPFLNLFYVLGQLMRHFGYKISGTFLSNADYRYLYLFSNYALERYNSQYEDTNRVFRYANHVPDILIADFLAALQNTANLYMDFSGNQVTINSRNEILNAEPDDYTTRVAGEFQNTRKNERGVRLQWTAPGGDSIFNEMAGSPEAEKITVKVNSFAELVSWSLANANKQQGDLAWLANENYLLKYDTAFGWSYYKERVDDYTTGDGSVEIQPQLAPLCSGVICDPSAGINNALNYAASGLAGNYTNNKGRQVENECGLQIFYIKRYATAAGPIPAPVSFTQAIAPDGTRRVRTGLSWHGADGLVEREWKGWLKALDGDTVKVSVYGLPDFNRPLLIRGVLYLVKKRFRKIGTGYQSPVEVELLKI